MLLAGVIVSDYTTLRVESLRDNARPEAGEVYGAMDMTWAKLVGQGRYVGGDLEWEPTKHSPADRWAQSFDRSPTRQRRQRTGRIGFASV
jgi:hypothetical protein